MNRLFWVAAVVALANVARAENSASYDEMSYLTTQAQCQIFLGRLAVKYGNSKVLSAVDNAYQREQRSEPWASTIETQLSLAVSSSNNAELVVRGGDCRTSLCRFDMQMPKAMPVNISMARYLGPQFLTNLRQLGISVDVTHSPNDEAHTMTMYVYSLSPPEQYVESIPAQLQQSGP